MRRVICSCLASAFIAFAAMSLFVRFNEAAEPGPKEPLVLKGTVLGPDGRPTGGAEIRLLHYLGNVSSTETEVLTLSGPDGKFEIRLGQEELAEDGREPLDRFARLVATKPGFGIAFAPALCFDPSGRLTAQLTQFDRDLLRHRREPEQDVLPLVGDHIAIRGRLIDEKGNGIKGATVAAMGVTASSTGRLDEWERAAGAKRAEVNSTLNFLNTGVHSGGRDNRGLRCIPPVTTDDQGRFTIRGIGEERVANLLVSAAGHESAMLRPRTRSGPTIRVPHDAARPFYFATYYPNEFEHTLPAAKPLEGQVVDELTNRPIAGARITLRMVAGPHSDGLHAYLGATSDPAGFFRMEGVPRGAAGYSITPPAESSHVIGAVYTTAMPEFSFQRVKLTPGILIHGQAVDATSGKPIVGTVTWFALKRNENAKCASFGLYHDGVEARTDSQGRYQLAVLAGEGILAFGPSDDAAYPHGKGLAETKAALGIADDLTQLTAPNQYAGHRHHQVRPVNVKEGEKPAYDFSLTRGESIPGRIIEAAVIPNRTFWIHGLSAESGWRTMDEPTFLVQGYVRTTGRRVIVVREPDNHVGFVDLTGDPSKEVVVKLQPGGRIRGRIVDPKGKPDPKLVLYEGDNVQAFPEPGSGTKAQRDRGAILDSWMNQSLFTDEDGRFEVAGVVPGLKYTLGVEGEVPECGDCYLDEIFRDIVVAAGQTRDLGDIVVDRSKEKYEVRTVVGP